MTKTTNINLSERLSLRIEKEFSQQMDSIIQDIHTVAEEFTIAQLDKKSPFRNVLAVAVEAGSSLEVIKNYIRYQVGRSESSPIWKHKVGQYLFAEVIVNKLDGLKQSASQILARVQSVLQDDDLKGYLNANKNSLLKEIQFKLAQLYLGYLAREHTAQVGEMKQRNSKNPRSEKSQIKKL